MFEQIHVPEIIYLYFQISRFVFLIHRGGFFSKKCALREMTQYGIDEIFGGQTFKNTSCFNLRFTTRLTTTLIHVEFLISRWVPGFKMDSWIHVRFLYSRWVPGFTMGSWIHDGFLVPGTARQGHIWDGTDHKSTARKYLARHGSTRSGHGTARDIPDIGTFDI